MREIVVIGLGPGDPGLLTMQARVCLENGRPLFFRTAEDPVAKHYLAKKSGAMSFDRYYEEAETFDSLYWKITRHLVRSARAHGSTYYAVPGHPSAGEETVGRLRQVCPRLGIRLRIIPGLSFLEPVLDCIGQDLLDGLTVCDAQKAGMIREPARGWLVIAQLFNRSLASRVKLSLLEIYPASHPATVVRGAGTQRPRLIRMPLYAIDRGVPYDHLTTLCLAPYRKQTIGDLQAIMARLRSPDGCPWDREQTNSSLRQYLIEEAYEVVAAVDKGDDKALKEELGDLLLQVIFHSRIAAEEDRFDLGQVIETICTKLVRRHPHVFGAKKAGNASDVKLIWEEVKQNERGGEKKAGLSLDQSLPALLKAYKIQKKAADYGFDWPDIQGPLDKAVEELVELKEAIAGGDPSRIEEELGDYLFTAVNLARFLRVNPEMALGKTTQKFIERFQYVADSVFRTGRPLNEFTIEELDLWWEEAKKNNGKGLKRRIPPGKSEYPSEDSHKLK